jgi:hypothetical protein
VKSQIAIQMIPPLLDKYMGYKVLDWVFHIP